MSSRVLSLLAFLSLVSLALCLAPSRAAAQAVAPRDAQAVALLNAAVTALDNSTTVEDITLQATVAYVAGSDQESGTATLEAKVGGAGNGGNKSKMALNLSGGPRLELRNGTAGAWVGPDGVSHSMSVHNCWSEAGWFAPGLALQAALNDPSVGMAWVGLESYGGSAVQHVQLFRVVAGQSDQATAVLIQALSSTDVYLDGTTSQPLALGFNTHADADAGTNIPVMILLGSYQAVNTVLVPYHVQKLLQGTLMLDFTVTGAAINTGTPDSAFFVQYSGRKP